MALRKTPAGQAEVTSKAHALPQRARSLLIMVDGKRTLILVSDNNFNPAQFTQFIALTVDGPLP